MICDCGCFILDFHEEPAEFELDFHETGECFCLDFGEVYEVEHGYDPYLGPYEVIPLAWQDQILPTSGKNMTGDVTVFEVPYAEVSNPYGDTVTIAS